MAQPRSWVEAFGELVRFSARVLGAVYGGRVLRFFGEALRQSGILILSSMLVICGLVFIIGLECGHRGRLLHARAGHSGVRGSLLRLV